MIFIFKSERDFYFKIFFEKLLTYVLEYANIKPCKRELHIIRRYKYEYQKSI